MTNPSATNLHRNVIQRYERPFWEYYLISVGYIVVLYVVSKYIVTLTVVGISFMVIVVATPIIVMGAYRASVTRILFTFGLRDGGFIKRVLSGYIPRLVTHLVLAVLAAVVSIVTILYTPQPSLMIWVCIGSLALIMYPMFRCIDSRIRKEVENWRRSKVALTISGLIVAIIVTVVYLLAMAWTSEMPLYGSLRAALDAQPNIVTASRPIGLLFEYYGQLRGIGEFGFGLLRTTLLGSIVHLSFYGLGMCLYFFSIAVAFSCFCIRPCELRRIVAKPEALDVAPPAGKQHKSIAAVILFGVTALFVIGFWGLTRVIDEYQGQCVLPGTVSELSLLKERKEADLKGQLGSVTAAAMIELESSVGDLFSAMKSNVDDFIEWQYRIDTEARRIGLRTIRMGSVEKVEEWTLEQLNETLISGVPTGEIDAQAQIYRQMVEALIFNATDSYQVQHDLIVRENTIDSCADSKMRSVGPTTIVGSPGIVEFELAEQLREAHLQSQEDFLQRLGTSFTVGTLSGVVAATIVGKGALKRGPNGVIIKLINRAPTRLRPLMKTVLIVSKATPATLGVFLVITAVSTAAIEYISLKYDEKEQGPALRSAIMKAIDDAHARTINELRKLVYQD